MTLTVWMFSSNDEFNSSLTSTFSTLAICNNVSSPGCDVFVHHLETVAGSFFNCSASHLLVRFCSTRTTLIRFISFVASILDYVINLILQK